MRNVHAWKCRYANHTLENWSLRLFLVHIKTPFVRVWRRKIRLLVHFGMCPISQSIPEILAALMKQLTASIRNLAKAALLVIWIPDFACSFSMQCMAMLAQ